MGSRGSFKNVDAKDFRFIENGKNYHSVGEISSIKVLVQDSGSVKAPEFSHTENRTYAIIQNGQLKHLTHYNVDHNQEWSIDFMHKHNGLIPHIHYYLDHTSADYVSNDKLELANKIRRVYKLK